MKDHVNVFRAEDVVYQLPVAHVSLSRDAFNGKLDGGGESRRSKDDNSSSLTLMKV